jgi:isocitrate lyase
MADAMNITKEQLKYHKKIGKLNGRAVFELATKGGFHMVVAPKGTGFETLGTGSHPALARHIAGNREKDIVWTELSKSDWVSPSDFAELIPKYEEITHQIRRAQGDE